MVLDAVANFVRGTSTESIDNSQTAIAVDDASIFPDPSMQGEFNVVIWDVNNFPRPDQDGDVEIMRVTARDSDTNELTVTRGQEMTSAAAHPEGSAIHLSPTAKMFSDIESTFGDFWNAGTQELTADVNNTNTTTTTLKAEDLQADLDGDLIPVADPIEKYEQSSATSSDVTVQFEGLSRDTMYLVRYSIHPSDGGSMQITFNGDDADSNGNYSYYDETGTIRTAEDAIEVADYDSNPALDGVFSFRKQASIFRVGLNNRPMPGNAGQLNRYTDSGGWDNENEPGLDSVTVTFVNGLRSGNSVVILEALQ